MSGTAFRTTKHRLATRPIFHKLDETIRGQVLRSYLALVLKAELEARIEQLGQKGSWPATIADLDALTETEIEQDGGRSLLRSSPKPAASLALRADVALPPTVQGAPQSDCQIRTCSAKAGIVATRRSSRCAASARP